MAALEVAPTNALLVADSATAIVVAEALLAAAVCSSTLQT
jgi:hypothetical protein